MTATLERGEARPLPGTRPSAFSRRRILVILAVAVLCPLWGLPALVLTVALLSPLMPADTPGRRAGLALIALWGAQSVTLTIVAVVGLRTSPNVLALVALSGAAFARRRTLPTQCTKYNRHASRLPAALGCITFAVLMLPFVGTTTGETMMQLSRSTDAGTHFGIVRAVVQAGGYINLRDEPGWAPGATDYPDGFASAVWVLTQLVTGHDGSAVTLVGLVVVSVATFAALTALTLAAAFETCQASRLTVRGRLALTGVWGLVMVAGPGLLMLQAASYTQIAAMTVLVGIALLPSPTHGGPVAYTTVLILGMIVVAHTWYLLLPVAAIIAGAQLLRRRPSAVGLLLGLLIGAAFCAYPVLTGPNASTQVNAPGMTSFPGANGVLCLLATASIGTLFLLRSLRVDGQRATPLAVTVVSMLLLTAALAVLTPTHDSTINYYTAKVLLGTLLLGSAVGAGALPALLSRASATWTTILGTTAAVCLLLAPVTTHATTWPPATTAVASGRQAAALDSIFARHARGPGPGEQIWITGSCDPHADRTASKWIYERTLSWSQERVQTRVALLNLRNADVSNVLLLKAQRPAVTRMYVYVVGACPPARLNDLEHAPKVTVRRVQ